MSFFSELGNAVGGVIGAVAPTIATALGGPLAGAAVTAIGGALGIDTRDARGEKDLRVALQQPTADQLVSLKSAELAFAAKLAELGIDVARIHAEDRNSARQREMQTGDSWTPRVLAGIALLSFVACIVFVFWARLTELPAEQIALMGGVIGYASAKADMVLAYYFGSSKGSEEKNTLLWQSKPQ